MEISGRADRGGVCWKHTKECPSKLPVLSTQVREAVRIPIKKLENYESVRIRGKRMERYGRRCTPESRHFVQQKKTIYIAKMLKGMTIPAVNIVDRVRIQHSFQGRGKREMKRELVVS
jgi:hypothetical protein